MLAPGLALEAKAGVDFPESPGGREPPEEPGLFLLPSDFERVALGAAPMGFPSGSLYLLVDGMPYLSLSADQFTELRFFPAATDLSAQSYMIRRGPNRAAYLVVALPFGRLLFVDLGADIRDSKGWPLVYRLALSDGGSAWLVAPRDQDAVYAIFSISGDGVYRVRQRLGPMSIGRFDEYFPGPGGQLLLHGKNVLTGRPKKTAAMDYALIPHAYYQCRVSWDWVSRNPPGLDFSPVALDRAGAGPGPGRLKEGSGQGNVGEPSARPPGRPPDWPAALSVRDLGRGRNLVGYPNGAVGIAGANLFDPDRILLPALPANFARGSQAGYPWAAPPEARAESGQGLPAELIPSVWRDAAAPSFSSAPGGAPGEIVIRREGREGLLIDSYVFEPVREALRRVPACGGFFARER
jgi:hypothetical protein